VNFWSQETLAAAVFLNNVGRLVLIGWPSTREDRWLELYNKHDKAWRKRGRLGGQDFKARSADRDAETDRSRIRSIVTAIEAALRSAENEQLGLNRRVDDVLARAAVTLGNGTDEYLEREPLDSQYQDLFQHRNFQRSTAPQGT